MSSKSKLPPESLADVRIRLAAAEYLNRFLTTCDIVQAEDAYRKAVGDFGASVPEHVERKALELRSQMLAILDPYIRKIKREEHKEFEVLHAQMRRVVLKDEIAETGIPDKVDSSHLREMEAEDLTYAINGFQKLQEMRRNLLSS